MIMHLLSDTALASLRQARSTAAGAASLSDSSMNSVSRSTSSSSGGGPGISSSSMSVPSPASAWERRDVGRSTRVTRSEEHTSELQSRQYLVCRLLLEKKKN